MLVHAYPNDSRPLCAEHGEAVVGIARGFIWHCACDTCRDNASRYLMTPVNHAPADPDLSVPGWIKTGLTADYLGATDHGAWLITTLGSHYTWLIDPDGVLYERSRGEHANHFPEDGQHSHAAWVHWWPAVGGRMYFGDPRGTWRRSSAVTRIERLTPESGIDNA